jgi:hypothetical protein
MRAKDTRSFYEQNPRIAREQQQIQAHRNAAMVNHTYTDWTEFHKYTDDIANKIYKLLDEKMSGGYPYIINYNAINNILNTAGPCILRLRMISESLRKLNYRDDPQKAISIKDSLEKETSSAILSLWRAYKSEEKIDDGIPQDMRKIFAAEVIKIDRYGDLNNGTAFRNCMKEYGVLIPTNFEILHPQMIPAQQIIEPVNNIQQDGIEDEAMINELKNQLAQIKAQIEQQANKLAEKDQAIAEKDNVIAEKDNVIAEKDGIILEEQNKNIIVTQELQNQKEINQSLQEENQVLKGLNSDLTEQLASSKEANVMLQEQVGNLTEEKLEITNKFNDPNHYEIIDSNVMGQLPINNQLNDLE